MCETSQAKPHGRRCPVCGDRMKCRKTEVRQGERYGIPYTLRPYRCNACGATDEDIIFNHQQFADRERQQDEFRRNAERQAAEHRATVEKLQNMVNLRIAQADVERAVRSLQKTSALIAQRLT